MKGAPVLVIPPQGGELTILMHPAKDTFIEFPRDIRKTHIPLSRPFYEARHRYNLLRLRLAEKKHIAVGSKGHVMVETGTGNTTVYFRVAERLEDATGRLVLELASEAEARHQEIDRRVALLLQQAGGAGQQLTEPFARKLVARARAMRKAGQHEVLDSATRAAAPCTALMDAGATRVGPDTLLVAFGVVNGCAGHYRMAEVAVRDRYKSVNHAGPTLVWSSAEKKQDGVLAVIPPGEEATGLMMVNTAALAPGPLSVTVSQPGGLQPIVAAVYEWDFTPVKPPYQRLVSLHVQALAGAMWLGDGIGLDDLDATSMKGLGVRVSYDLSEMFGFEADMVGASTGDARFANVTYNGVQGDLARSAALGRVQLGGIMRLGEKIIPTVRLGLGLQGASHSAAFTPAGGGVVQEPDVGFEFSTSVNFGAGIDLRLGEYLIAGVAISAVTPIGGDDLFRRSLEAGAHLGYAWNP